MSKNDPKNKQKIKEDNTWKEQQSLVKEERDAKLKELLKNKNYVKDLQKESENRNSKKIKPEQNIIKKDATSVSKNNKPELLSKESRNKTIQERKGNVTHEDAYRNPEKRENISSGDAKLDFLYNNDWLMDVPILGGYIKNKAKDIAGQSGGSQVVDLNNLGDSKYTGNTTDQNSPTLLDQYFSKEALLPNSKYKPKQDYYNFLPSYSLKGDFDKNYQLNPQMKENFRNAIESNFNSPEEYTQFLASKKPIYKSNTDASSVSDLVGADLGGHKTGMAWDPEKNMPYISMSDAWDFEPTHYSDKWGKERDIDTHGELKQQKDKAYIQSYLMHKAGNPYKVYDRFYFDPKTKDYIPDNNLNKVEKINNPIPSNQSKFAYGGDLNTQDNNMLTEFNEGGSHSQNPNGGIPMGMNPNGKQNTVEQGETKKGQFVYSDRLYINEDLAKQMNLPSYIRGKSFAEASKSINNKFKDRNDIHTKATQKELLDRLAQSQEQLKAEQDAINQSMQVNQSEVEYPEQSQEFEEGGFMDFIKKNGSSIGNIGGTIGGVINPGGYYGEDIDKANRAGFDNSHLKKSSQIGEGLDAIGGTVASAFGPVGSAIFGAKKLGESIGGAIGGDGGAAVSSLFSPEKSALTNLTDRDLNIGQKALGMIPGVGGVIAQHSADKKLKEFKKDKLRSDMFYKYKYKENNNDIQTFAEGGNLGDPKKPDPTKKMSVDQLLNYNVGDPSQTISSRYLDIVGMQKGVNHPKRGMGAYFYSGKTPNDPGYDPMANREFIQNDAIQQYLNSEQGKKYQLALKNQIDMETKSGTPITSYSYLNPVATPTQFAKGGYITSQPAKYANGGLLPGMATQDDIMKFQDYLDSKNYNWVKGSKLNKGAGYGNLGPSTKSAYDKYYPEYKKGLLNSIDEEGLKKDLILSQDKTVTPFDADKFFNYDKSNTEQSGEKPGFFSKENLSNIGNNLLRYSPIIGNMLQKSGMGAVEVEKPIRNPYQYQKQYIDESTGRNIAEQTAAGTMEALNKSGLSGNRLLAASLGSQLNKTKGISEAAMQAKLHNINENKLAEQVKQQNEGDFIADTRRIADVNAQNRANYDTQKSKFNSAIGSDLGEIGKEETFKRMAQKMTGYDWLGEYTKANPNATQEEKEKALAEEIAKKKTEPKAYGGLMKLKFKKY